MTRFRLPGVLLALACLVMGCGGGSQAKKPAAQKLSVALLLDSLTEERSQRDRDLFVERAKELGADVTVKSADGDAALQEQQAREALNDGVKALVIVPVDTEKAAAIAAAAQEAQVLLTKAGARPQPKLEPELRVIAQFGMGIQWQVVGEQVDVVRKKQGQALLHPAGHPAVLAAPEQPVMHEDGIGSGLDRRLDQCAAGGDAGHQSPHFALALDLQPIGPIILEPFGLEQAVEGL
jgi:hypothetical protein